MNPLLAPQPMTPAEVASLIERTKANEEIARRRGGSGREPSAPRGVAKQAALWAHEHNATFVAAGLKFNCSDSAVRLHYYRMFAGLRSVAR